MSDKPTKEPPRHSWMWWLAREVGVTVAAFAAALVATGATAFCLALTFGPDDPRPEPWSTAIFYLVFFGLLGWSIRRDMRRSRLRRRDLQG